MADESLTDVVTTALAEANLPGIDSAAARLAILCAEEIDDGEPLARYGALLLRTLDALMMTPKSRIAARTSISQPTETSHEQQPEPADELDALRKRRDSRADRAAVVDSPAP